MNNFNFCVPTDIRFGKGQIECLPDEIKKYGKKILLVYGGGSIKRTGLTGRTDVDLSPLHYDRFKAKI